MVIRATETNECTAKGYFMKIERIELFPLCYPCVRQWKFIEGAPGHTVILVKITADNGTVGWGQSVPIPTWSYETLESALAVLRWPFIPALIGRDPLDLEGAVKALDAALAPSFSVGMPLARAGLDIALHDLAGKLTGQSIAEMWGRPKGGTLQLGWTISVKSLDDLDPEIETARQRGYRSFNVKIAPDPRFDLEVVRRVRKAAPESFLWVDANGGYDLPTALEVAPKLADEGVDVMEAPLRPNRITGYQALKRQGALPITMDEGLVSPVEVEEFIKLGMIDGLTAKVSRSGGLTSARRQIEIALDAGLFWLGSGLTDPDVSLAASLVLYGAYGLSKPAALNGPQFLDADILQNPLTIQGDMVEVPSGPGLGIDIDERKVAALAYKSP